MPRKAASFVIPVYNGAAWLAETLDACQRQTVKKIEIVVVDDCSTDSTKKVIEYFAKNDKRIVPIYFAENKGRSSARNAGINAAQSDIILTNDADDIPNLNRVKKTTQFLDANPDVDVVYGGFWVLDPINQVQGEVKAEPFNYQRMLNSSGLFFHIGHSTMAFRKKVFEKVQYVNGDFSKHGIDDWRLQLELHRAGFKYGLINAPLVYYRYIPKKRDEETILALKKSVI